MNIQSIHFGNEDGTILRVVDKRGNTLSVPWPCQTWHQEPIQEWLDAGNTIKPHTRFSTLKQARETLTAEAYYHASSLIDAKTSGYSQGEMLRWHQLEAEARALQAGDPPGPYISAEAAASPRTDHEIAAIVVAKADALEAYRVAVIGARTGIVEQINATPLAELEVLDISSPVNWP